jgi:hypothetical protein
MKKLLGTLVLLLFPLLLQAQCTGSSPTWTSTPDQSSVNTCVSNASPGDTIKVLSGAATWTAGVSTSKNLSIVGAGAGSTVINDDLTSSCGALFTFTPTSVGSLTRISGMTIQPRSGANAVCPAMRIQGTCNASDCPHLRIDHITFSGWDAVTRIGNSYGITAIGDVFGVIDHNTINATPGNLLAFTEISHAAYQGVGAYGDNSWHQPEAYGSQNFLFFENNIFNTASCCDNEGDAVGGVTARGGSRVVVRFNTFNNMDNLSSCFGWHGTESNGRPRSGRAFEFYENIYVCPPGVHCGSVASVRGGTGLLWGNTITLSGAGLTNFFSFTTYRASANNGGWGACDGSAPYDTNDGVVYFSGSIGSVSTDGSTGAATITVSGTNPGWTANHWSPAGAPYSVHDITQNNGAEISANGANTLTTTANSGGPGSWLPAPGDSIQILRATACIDQAGGRGAGILYDSTQSPAHAVSANEVSSPSYFWLNPFNGASPSFCTDTGVCSGTGRVVRNRDYYAESLNQAVQSSSTSPFDGTKTLGIGHGTLTDRPATCTIGTAYWATDQGSWNTSSSGGQGVLYICGASGWPSTPSYIPYTYPHPLTAGTSTGGGGSGSGGNSPNPPTGLTATVQ